MNELNEEKVQLVCFDLGRVLIRIADDWKHACQMAGIPVPQREIDKDAIMELVVRNETGKADHDAFCSEGAAIFGLTAAQVRALSAAYLIGPYPGVSELLTELRSAGVKTACLSNTNPAHWQTMCGQGNCGLPMHLFDYRFASQEIGHRKPDPGIYEHAEKTAGLAGGAIAFFDDLPINVEAAQKRGWQARLIAHDGDPISQARKHLREMKVL